MTALAIRDDGACRYDLVALGEVMLRLDPGEGRVRTTRSFRVWEGGGEYNVARGLRRCFGLRTAIVTALADNDIGRLLEDLMLQGGVDTSLVRWVPDDGIGRTVRNGLNFTERGFGVRGALGVSDRGNSAASQLSPGQIDWDHLFGELGVRWLHTGGIFAALSETTPQVIEEALTAAARHGTVVSYDLNFRPSLWKGIGGIERAREVNRRLAKHVDVIIGNEEDFTACLGLEVAGLDKHLSELDTAAFRTMIEHASAEFPNLRHHRHHTPNRAHRNRQRLGSDRLVPRRRIRRGDLPPPPRDHGSRGRRRQLRRRPHLRTHGTQRPPCRFRARRSTRRTRNDNPRRHINRDARGSRGARSRRRSPHPALTAVMA